MDTSVSLVLLLVLVLLLLLLFVPLLLLVHCYHYNYYYHFYYSYCHYLQNSYGILVVVNVEESMSSPLLGCFAGISVCLLKKPDLTGPSKINS